MAWPAGDPGSPGLEHPRYAEGKLLGTGAFSTVKLAEDRVAGGAVALKLLRRSEVASSRHAESEILNQMRLQHPHIIAIKELLITEDHVALVLEYAAGGDLAARVPSAQGLPEPDARWFFQQIMFGLEYCHRMGIASRDIKLENVLLDSEGPRPLVKLADWGLSAACDPQGRVRHEGALGTPMYFAPELLVRAAPGETYDAKAADVWSCGVLLLGMLTGTSPFQRAADAKLPVKQRLRALVKRILRLDYHLPSWLPAGVQDLIARMLVADPRQRPTVAEVLHHPWCSEGISAAAMLYCNDRLVARSLASPPAPELIAEVQSIMREARLAPSTPRAARCCTSLAASAASMAGSRPCSYHSSGSEAVAPCPGTHLVRAAFQGTSWASSSGSNSIPS